MSHMTASRAKQNFGELLEAVMQGPVAIERHKSIKAIVCSPETFQETVQGHSSPALALEDRRAARAAQQLVEKNRLIKHQKLAIELLLMPRARREELILCARAEVLRWRRDRLCSADYADRWDDLLGRSIGDLTQAMCSETLEWGAALRQNSPWHLIELTSPRSATICSSCSAKHIASVGTKTVWWLAVSPFLAPKTRMGCRQRCRCPTPSALTPKRTRVESTTSAQPLVKAQRSTRTMATTSTLSHRICPRFPMAGNTG